MCMKSHWNVGVKVRGENRVWVHMCLKSHCNRSIKVKGEVRV